MTKRPISQTGQKGNQGLAYEAGTATTSRPGREREEKVLSEVGAVQQGLSNGNGS